MVLREAEVVKKTADDHLKRTGNSLGERWSVPDISSHALSNSRPRWSPSQLLVNIPSLSTDAVP